MIMSALCAVSHFRSLKLASVASRVYGHERYYSHSRLGTCAKYLKLPGSRLSDIKVCNPAAWAPYMVLAAIYRCHAGSPDAALPAVLQVTARWVTNSQHNCVNQLDMSR